MNDRMRLNPAEAGAASLLDAPYRSADHRNLQQRMGRTARRAKKRAAKQSIAHLGIQRFCVFYLKDGKEHRSPWFGSRSRAHVARELLATKYGPAIVYID